MANEAQIRVSIYARKGNWSFQNPRTSFNADITNAKGPVPGAISVPITGKTINFGELTRPGLCVIENNDSTNFVTLGVYDNSRFYPLAELLPGEVYALRLSRYLNQEFVGTGTGTNADHNQLMLIADSATCVCTIYGMDT